MMHIFATVVAVEVMIYPLSLLKIQKKNPDKEQLAAATAAAAA
eukprot:CAMPEP_0170884038 /NCGR_PEP_ID=MMETSP0734-20130129/34726_1 /TAXON_ID=186038 /ORGANISM="Fragilariopsis kerguelensis, Strain L26-C5" /LENGTH=42 /DNA_ID= /DNA_START= /DNA_END= /DNA_ORIENTATION=